MVFCVTVNEMAKLAVLMYFLKKNEQGRKPIGNTGHIMPMLLVFSLCLILQMVLTPGSYKYFLVQITILSIYIGIVYKNKLLYVFSSFFILYVLLDVLNIVMVFITFPIIIFGNVQKETLEADLCIMMVRLALYIGVMYVIRNKKRRYLQSISRAARMGIVLLCIMLEFAFLELRHRSYMQQDIILYRIFLFAIIFGVIILFLWIIDKEQEQKKIQELMAYSHRTREVIPSVGRVLARLEELSACMDKSDAIVEELRMICEVDMKGSKKEAANIKTFNTTGSVVLDEQLDMYLEEAAEQDFTLDIIVRAPMGELINAENIGIYPILQMIGDLYRNANKVVRKRGSGGHILICFGYNEAGDYEISVHDNGERFSPYVLEHLGEKGVTTDGTGHGMADVFQALGSCGGSFILNQELPESSIFTKGICIIFDDKGRKEIKGR